MLAAEALIEPLLAILNTAQFAEKYPALRNKVQKLVDARSKQEDHRVIRLAKRLCERCVKDSLAQVENVSDNRIWQLLKFHGCIYLADGNQDRVIQAVVDVFSSEQPSPLARTTLAERVLRQLSGLNSKHRFSKTHVNHVLQLLFRSGAFLVSRADGVATGCTVWQLREELYNVEQLRRVHDAAIVALAQQDGLFLSPAAWSRCLYRSTHKTSHFQSIVDHLRFGLKELAELVRKQHCLTFPVDTVNLLSQLAKLSDSRDCPLLEADVQCALRAVSDVLRILLRSSANVPTLPSATGLVSPSTSESSATFDLSVSLSPPRSNAFPITPRSDYEPSTDQLARQVAEQALSNYPPFNAVQRPSERPIRGRGTSLAGSDYLAANCRPSEFLPHFQNPWLLAAHRSVSAAPMSLCNAWQDSEVKNAASAGSNSSVNRKTDLATDSVRQRHRSSSVCDLSTTSEFDELNDDVFPSLSLVSSAGLFAPESASPTLMHYSSAAQETQQTRLVPLYLRTLSEAAKDDFSR